MLSTHAETGAGLGEGDALVFKEYLAECGAEVGVVVDPARKAQRDSEQGRLREQSHAIARALEKQGVPAYRCQAWAVWRVFGHSGEIEALPSFRHSTLIPWVAQKDRRELLAAAEWWLQLHPFDRFWTFTNGTRCQVDTLRDRCVELHDRIRRLNAQPFMQAAGVQIVLRSTELGTLENQARPGRPAWETRSLPLGKLDFPKSLKNTVNPHSKARRRKGKLPGQIQFADDKVFYHPHAHCIAHLAKGPLSHEDWVSLVNRVWLYWEDHWDAGEMVRDAREAIKYPFKPGAVAMLADRDSPELKRLFTALFGLHLVQPLGPLRAAINREHAMGNSLVRQRTPDGKVWSWGKKPVWHFTSTNPEPDAEPDDQTGKPVPERPPRIFEDFSCRLVAICPPAAGPSTVKEPVFMLVGNKLDPETINRDPLAQAILSATAEDYARGCAVARVCARASVIRVHTGTVTARAGPDPPAPAWKSLAELLE